MKFEAAAAIKETLKWRIREKRLVLDEIDWQERLFIMPIFHV